MLGRLGVLDDSAIVAELDAKMIRRPSPRESAHLSYAARMMGRGDHQLDVELSQAGATVRAWIALPVSLRPQPWLVEWESDEDPEAWVRQLADWLDEEMYTDGLGPAYLRVLETPSHDSWWMATAFAVPTTPSTSAFGVLLVRTAGTLALNGASS